MTDKKDFKKYFKSFRGYLVSIRKQYNTNAKKLFTVSGIIALISIAMTILADIFLPFSDAPWATLIRSALLVPTSISIFVFGYGVSLFLHYSKMDGDPQWVPFRYRFSPTWRRRISLVIAALLFVIIYANGERVGYTALSAAILAVGISLFAFMRTTVEEAKREKFEIPDVRDTKYDANMKKLSNARKTAQNNRKKRKEEKDKD